MGEAPLVSVLMPCHNAEPYVGEALESVLAQTWRQTEIVAVDDGSTDRTGEVLDRYRERGVAVLHQDRAGAATARNRAFAQSRGAFVLYLDADDLIGPRHLEALLAALTEGSQQLAMSQWDRFYRDPSKARFPARKSYCDLPGPDWLARDWTGGEPMTQPGMFLIPRSLVETHGGWDERLSLIDDFEFFARMIARSDGIRFAPDGRLFYRSGIAGTLSAQKSRTAAESAWLALVFGTQHLLHASDTASTRRASANMLQTFIYTFYPRYPDLRGTIARRIAALGGSDLPPPGPPGFQKLRPLLGWRAARRLQLLAERWGLNRAARTRMSSAASQ